MILVYLTEGLPPVVRLGYAVYLVVCIVKVVGDVEAQGFEPGPLYQHAVEEGQRKCEFVVLDCRLAVAVSGFADVVVQAQEIGSQTLHAHTLQERVHRDVDPPAVAANPYVFNFEILEFWTSQFYTFYFEMYIFRF